MSSNFQGVFTALATPMTESGEVDYKRLESFTDSLIKEGGVHGIIPLGSTGEYYALSDQEKTEVMKIAIRTVGRRVPVLMGTNAGSTREVIRLSQEAQKLGADGLLLAAPYYSLPRPDEIYAHFAAVDAAVGIPIMLYNYPARTGVDLTPDLVERLAGLKNIDYIKESSGSSQRVSEIIRRCGSSIKVFCGSDAIAFESFLLGAIGWVAGVANVLPKEHVELYNLVSVKKDIPKARALLYRLLPVLEYYEGNGKYCQFVKAGCAVKGKPIGSPRQPLLPATQAEIDTLTALLTQLEASGK